MPQHPLWASLTGDYLPLLDESVDASVPAFEDGYRQIFIDPFLPQSENERPRRLIDLTAAAKSDTCFERLRNKFRCRSARKKEQRADKEYAKEIWRRQDPTPASEPRKEVRVTTLTQEMQQAAYEQGGHITCSAGPDTQWVAFPPLPPPFPVWQSVRQTVV